MNIDLLVDKTENFKGLSQKEKVKCMAYFYQTLKKENYFSAKNVEDLFVEGKIDGPSNIHDVLGKLLKDRPRDVIKSNGKYTLERHYVKQMDSIYLNGRTAKVIVEMAALLEKIKNHQQKEFLEDALKCVNAHIYRAAIIMTWLLVMDVLYEFILNYKLADFNAELKKRNLKYTITSKSDFEDIKESTFIEVMRASSIISKEQKKTLDDKLDIRNSAAHPNQTSFKEAKVVSFIEELIADIVEKFQ